MSPHKPAADKHSVEALKARQQEFEQRTATYGTLLGVLVIGGLVIAAVVSTGVVWSMVLGAALGVIRMFAPSTNR